MEFLLWCFIDILMAVALGVFLAKRIVSKKESMDFDGEITILSESGEEITGWIKNPETIMDKKVLRLKVKILDKGDV